MEVKISITATNDRLVMVNSEKLFKLINPKDLEQRNSKIIENAYHKEWFCEWNNSTYFKPPAISIREGEIFFINGRHRTILLARHINELPVIVGNIDYDATGGRQTKKSLEALDYIKIQELKNHSSCILPKLDFGNFKPE